MKKALIRDVCGFIGGHLFNRLESEGYWVRGVDLKENYYSNLDAYKFIVGDVRIMDVVGQVVSERLDEVYQLASEMVAGFVLTGVNDSNFVHNGVAFNFNILEQVTNKNIPKFFYSSSASMYGEYNQMETDNPKCNEGSAYPATQDVEYDWEKHCTERLFLTYHKNFVINVKITRFHNIFGPQGTWDGGREKGPAAICGKVANAKYGDSIEVWGGGLQTRSFLMVDECVEGLRRLMESDFRKMVVEISKKDLTIKNIEEPTSVRGRNFDNSLIKEKIGWVPSEPSRKGVELTYSLILSQLKLFSE